MRQGAKSFISGARSGESALDRDVVEWLGDLLFSVLPPQLRCFNFSFPSVSLALFVVSGVIA